MHKSYIYLGVSLLAITLMLTAGVYLAWPKRTAAKCAVEVPVQDGKHDCVQFEWVRSEEARAKGLSGRPSLLPNEGMAFGFAAPGKHCLWMKDMKFSIDMIWLSPGQRIVKIARNVSPDTYPTSFCPSKDAQYILEVASGIADKAGLRLGQKLNLDATGQ